VTNFVFLIINIANVKFIKVKAKMVSPAGISNSAEQTIVFFPPF